MEAHGFAMEITEEEDHGLWISPTWSNHSSTEHYESWLVCYCATGSTTWSSSIWFIEDEAAEHKIDGCMYHQLAAQTKRGLKTTVSAVWRGRRWRSTSVDPDTGMGAFLILATLLSIFSLCFGQGNVPTYSSYDYFIAWRKFGFFFCYPSSDCQREFLENVDFPGTDIKFVYAADVTHCQHLCTHHASCLFFTFLRLDWTQDRRFVKLGQVTTTEVFKSLLCTFWLSWDVKGFWNSFCTASLGSWWWMVSTWSLVFPP